MNQTHVLGGLASIVLLAGCTEQSATNYCATIDGPIECCNKYRISVDKLSIPRYEGMQYAACSEAPLNYINPVTIYQRSRGGEWELNSILNGNGWIIEEGGKLTNWSAGK